MSTIRDVYDDLHNEQPFIGPLPAPKPAPIGTSPFHDMVREALSADVEPAFRIAKRIDVSIGATHRVLQMLVWNDEAEQVKVDGEIGFRTRTRHPQDVEAVVGLIGRTITRVDLDYNAHELEIVLDDGTTLHVADPTGDQGLVLWRRQASHHSEEPFGWTVRAGAEFVGSCGHVIRITDDRMILAALVVKAEQHAASCRPADAPTD